MKSAIYFLGLCALGILLVPVWLCLAALDWIDLHLVFHGNFKAKERADWKAR